MLEPFVVEFDPEQHEHVTPYLAAIHASCITHDGTVATFLPPLSDAKITSWWKARATEIGSGDRLIWLLINKADSSEGFTGAEVMGVVMLQMPVTETGPFRGNIEKLLVHHNFRGRGGATLLMRALESEAIKRGRTKLMLDTEAGSAAEVYLYPKLGYKKLGVMPEYGIGPTGELKDLVYFYKFLK
ncbi:hypothetical protein Golomagni_08183 [Golovinomyces magnicellulatus]|nr:hypothetical protein Golomagni_08183 [Golovinomyces magnicellulatus]